MNMLDSDVLVMIGEKTRVDFHARKLKGLTLLKLILEVIRPKTGLMTSTFISPS